MYSFASRSLGKARAARPHSVTRVLPFLHTRVRQQHSLDDIKKYVKEWDSFKGFQPEYNKNYTNILKSLASATIEPCSKSGTVKLLKTPTPVGSEDEISPNVIYVRHFFDELLKKIRKYRKTVLIGNPGIGKSWFQWYYLARLTNPELLRLYSLPSDCFGNTEPPKVVIRQEGLLRMVVFFLEAKVAYVVRPADGCLLDCFDPNMSLYFFEPFKTKTEEPEYNHRIPTLATVSPAIDRYKEFCKHKGEKLFMPVWSFEELKEVYQFLEDNKLIPDEMQHLYSYKEIENRFKQIENRFKQFGGILRHVLPRSETYLNETKKNQESAILETDPPKLLAKSPPDIEKANVSHFILQYKVEMQGPKAFEDRTMDWVSSDVEFEVKAQFGRISLEDRIQFLIGVDKGERVDIFQSVPKIYETVVEDLLKEGVRWTLRNVNRLGGEAKFNVKLGKTTDTTNSPKFKEMVEGTLYKPAKLNYPVFDIMYIKKKKDKTDLIGIQVTTQKGGRREVDHQTFENWKKEIGIDGDEKVQVHFILCPHPSDANNASISFKGFPKESYPYQILQVPTGYGSSNLSQDKRK